MPRNYTRRATLVPWYHERKPRCITDTQAGEQCSYSASYVQTNHSGTVVCKIHKDMLEIEKGYRFRALVPNIVDIRAPATRTLRSVPFSSADQGA